MAMTRDGILGLLDLEDAPQHPLYVAERKEQIKDNVVINGNLLIKKGSVIEIQQPKKKQVIFYHRGRNMKTKDFTYLKAMGEKKSYSLMVLNETDKHLNGVAMNYLSDEERAALTGIQEKYEEDLKPFMNKAYRQFLKEKIVQ